jgi:beta-fructofuranosidase
VRFFRRPTDAAAAGDAIPFSRDGTMHLFYLSSPEGTQDYPDRVRTTWQHAASEDLTEWRELPPALTPGPPNSYDAGGIWTGSVVENDGIFYLFYTAHDPGAPNPQTICVATSTDLVSFERYPGNPLLLPPPNCESVDWRDPFVFFNEDENSWWMLIAARRNGGWRWTRGCIMLATSPDLISWTIEEEPLYDPGDTFCPECPELWAMDGSWYLVYSRFSESVGTTFRNSTSARGPFRIPPRDALGGRRWYAAKSAPWAGGRAFFGWIHDVVDQLDGRRRWLWGGDMALPRMATVAKTPEGPVIRLASAVAPEAGQLAGVLAPRHLGRIGAKEETVLADMLPACALIEAEFAAPDAAAVGIELVQETTETSVRLTIRLGEGRVTLTREPQPLDDFWADLTGRGAEYREVDGPILTEAHLLPGPGRRPIAVRLVVDGEILEAFVDEDVVLTHRMRRTDKEVVRVFVADGIAEISGHVAYFA